MPDTGVLIIGAGLAGLACARTLERQGVPFLILEAAGEVGGRIGTDLVDGFQLDRGFQVLLTAYPEAEAALDYGALDLHAFAPGALVRYHGRFYHMGDPWREPASLWPTLLAPTARFSDLWSIYRLRRQLLARSVPEIFAAHESSALHYLKRRRFSRRIIENFFKPWIGGAMLDTTLGGSSRMLEFLFKMFAEGEAAVPAAGMGAIPKQLAAGLPPGSIRLGARVESIHGSQVRLDSGEEIAGEGVVVAAECAEAARLLGWPTATAARGMWCFYFAAKEPPVEEPLLVLSGSGRGPVTSVAVMDAVCPAYAPKGNSLIAATVVSSPVREQEHLLAGVRSQLKRWFGLVVDEWRVLRIYHIERALPFLYPLEGPLPPRLAPGLFVCGDYRAAPSIQGALESGRLAAEAVAEELAGAPSSKSSV